MSANTMERAREALRLADDDPHRAAALAATAAHQARAERDRAAAAVAERAYGLAAIHVEDLETAIRHLRSGIMWGRRASAPALAAEARMTLAFALNRQGRSIQALHEIDTALLDLGGVEYARALAQRGAILHQLGRLDDALDSYRAAMPALRRAGDHLWMLRLLNNRGVLHGHRGEFTAAEADLKQAELLGEQLELGLWLAFTHQNRGWVYALRGDIPVALHHLHLAETRFRDLHSQVGSLLSDRAELLLTARLLSEARAVAEQAVEEFEREGRWVAVPEARLQLAQAAALDGDPTAALQQARRALREFTRQQRPEWAALARLTTLTCRAARTTRSRIALAEVERAADALVAARRPAPAIDARLLAARLALERGHRGRAIAQLQTASRARRRGPATLRARAWHAKALLRYANGDRRGAAAAIRAGLRILDEHRTTLNATDLRAHASAHRIELTTLGLRIAFDNGQPEQILEWAERGRASHLLLAPVRPPQDPILASLLADLRATVQDIDKARAGGLRETRLVQRQVALEMEIRDHCRRAEGELADSALGQVPAQQLTEALGEAALLEFIQLDDRLHVISIIDGRVQLRQLTELPPIRDLVDRIPFALRRLAGGRARPASRTAAVELLRHAAKQLDTALLWPLDDQIADRPLVLIPTGPLQSLPWAVLPSCAGRSVTVSPSAALWHAASRQPATDDGPVVVAAGPDLPGAYAEASAVGAIYHTPALAGPAATVDAVAAALSKAGLAHLAAHGRVQAQNPLFSSLRFADGPFTVYDLERLGRVPRLVVLAACDSGRTAVRPGDELLGLSVAFLNHGTQQLVASVAPIPDAETTPLMIAFHRLLAAGTPCPLALAQAQQQVASLGSTALATAAGFICIGAEYTIPLPTPPPRRSS